MQRYFTIIIVFAIVTGIKAQTNPATAVKKETAAYDSLVLIDTAFDNLGVKFGYPANYLVARGSSSASNMVFYNGDSSIILSVRTTGTTYQKATEGWPVKEKQGAKDHWFKHIGKTPQRHMLSNKPVYTSDYVYPFNYGGADFFWITILTTKPGIGLIEMEAVKKSLSPTAAPVETRDIIPGIATMEIPVYYQPTPSSRLSAFKAERRLLEVYKSEKKGTNSSILASEDLKKTGLAHGFTVVGNIKFHSDAGITFTGFYGRLVQKAGKYYEAHVFFENPASAVHECYGIRLRILRGMSLNLGKDLEAMLATVKFK